MARVNEGSHSFTCHPYAYPKKAAGLCRTDGKRPDGMTLIPWKAGKPVAWDVTAICTIDSSYIDSSARGAGAAAEIAALIFKINSPTDLALNL